MDAELGVLLASLLKGISGYEESYNALVHDLAKHRTFPKRLTWTGAEEDCSENDLVQSSC